MSSSSIVALRAGVSRAPPARPRPLLRRVALNRRRARCRVVLVPPSALFGGGGDAYPEGIREPLPLPEAVSTGLACALAGSKAALSSPSDAWKPLTAATLAVAVALEGAGFYAAGSFLSPGEDAGVVSSLISRLALVAVDGAWIFVAPLLAIAVVQQVLPLLGEKILFDGLRASAAAIAADDDQPSANAKAEARARRLEALEASDGLGLRGIGVAASRAQSLAALGAGAIPVGVGASLVPVAGPMASAAVAAAVAAYALAWELLDPYFDKAGLGFEAQERVVWANRFALVAFAAPFTAALAVPFVGPSASAVAQGAVGELVWRVLEKEPDVDEGGAGETREER
jgi:hypothetical protein